MSTITITSTEIGALQSLVSQALAKRRGLAEIYFEALPHIAHLLREASHAARTTKPTPAAETDTAFEQRVQAARDEAREIVKESERVTVVSPMPKQAIDAANAKREALAALWESMRVGR